MFLRPNVTRPNVIRRKCTRRNDTEPIGLSPRLKNAEVILEKTYFFCMQILYQAYTIF